MVAHYYGQRAVRNTLLADRCDVFFGLPDDKDFMGRQLDRTAPFLDVGYAVVVPPTFAFAGLEDLKRVTVAVQFRSPPQLLLATREGFPTTTFRHVEEAMDALARGEAGAAFVWGPTAGYYNKTRLAGAWRVVPVAGPGLQWQVEQYMPSLVPLRLARPAIAVRGPATGTTRQAPARRVLL